MCRFRPFVFTIFEYGEYAGNLQAILIDSAVFIG